MLNHTLHSSFQGLYIVSLKTWNFCKSEIILTFAPFPHRRVPQRVHCLSGTRILSQDTVGWDLVWDYLLQYNFRLEDLDKVVATAAWQASPAKPGG
jgi:hypothetical protein